MLDSDPGEGLLELVCRLSVAAAGVRQEDKGLLLLRRRHQLLPFPLPGGFVAGRGSWGGLRGSRGWCTGRGGDTGARGPEKRSPAEFPRVTAHDGAPLIS